MQGSRIRHILAALAIGFLSFLSLTDARAASDDAIGRCDALASDPRDPSRYARGVTEQEFAPGAAVEACKAAVDANPNLPRAWFQLGRSYWIAERDADAFAAFVKAERLGYAPAMKYIGEAYRQGRGLPGGEQQSVDVALAWYKKALSAGYKDAAVSIQDLSAAIASSTFDPSLFQNPKFMAILYSGDYSKIEEPILFFAYTQAFVEELGGTNVFFIDQSCKGMVTALGGLINGAGQVFAVLQSLQSQNGMQRVIASVALAQFVKDQGDRDAVTLMSTYKCTSPITRRIVDNTVGSYQKMPSIIQAFANPAQPGRVAPRQTQPPAVDERGMILIGEEASPLPPGALYGKCVSQASSECARLDALVASKEYKIVRCYYAKSGDVNPKDIFRFWYQKAPPQPDSFAIPGDIHPFYSLGAKAIDGCPKKQEDGLALYLATHPYTDRSGNR